ncbi:hypothetical protein C1O66_20395 [Paucibacter aquatile]|uniref:Uncharacterized protein n=1 Tax=Kinneretia aquatilis TaxID=2070761 RepID=A0A2N8KRL0_9BURK|nr:hypothetical protein [Paucibacter aquatile]PND36094.1 hypothetical protein C1O66_20395 [Paucibacter aquatile]
MTRFPLGYAKWIMPAIRGGRSQPPRLASIARATRDTGALAVAVVDGRAADLEFQRLAGHIAGVVVELTGHLGDAVTAGGEGVEVTRAGDDGHELEPVLIGLATIPVVDDAAAFSAFSR